jgi:DNA-binding CsgD family transcriptional regulator
MTALVASDTAAMMPSNPCLPELISRIGRADFDYSLLDFLNGTVGAEHCAILRREKDELVKLCAASLDRSDTAGQQIDLYVRNYWRSDPTMALDMSAQAPITLERLDLGRLPPSGLRDLVYRRKGVADRLLLRSVSGSGITSLSIVRTDRGGAFSDREVDCLLGMSGMLMAIVNRHAELVFGQSDLERALTSLETIIDCMEHAPERMPRREIEVCSRILYGLSSTGIGRDLNIGEETIKTYRKRAYQRLGIATQHELLVWYVRRWNQRRLNLH